MKSFPGTCFSFSIPAIFLISMAVELSSHLVRNMHCRTGYNLYYSLHASDENEVFLCSMSSGLLELGCLDIHAQEVFQQGHGNCSWSMKNMENCFFFHFYWDRMIGSILRSQTSDLFCRWDPIWTIDPKMEKRTRSEDRMIGRGSDLPRSGYDILESDLNLHVSQSFSNIQTRTMLSHPTVRITPEEVKIREWNERTLYFGI